MKARISIAPLAIALATLFGMSQHAFAERADRDQPVNIEADNMTVDDRNKVHVFEGSVVLTQGSLVIKGDKLVVTQDAAGFQNGVATASGGKLA
ncbi:MAG: lipopolysaccharide export system protein LptA, partial [Thauera sp.]